MQLRAGYDRIRFFEHFSPNHSMIHKFNNFNRGKNFKNDMKHYK